jgi:WD40 repeat protein
MSVNQLQLDGDTLLSASNDRTVRIWDIAANRMRVYQGHDSLVNSAVRIDQTSIRGGGGEMRPEMIVSGSNIGELFTFEVDRRPSNDPIERKGYFSGGKQKGFAFASPVNDIKVVEYGGVQLVNA